MLGNAHLLQGVPSVYLDRIVDEENGDRWISMKIESFPAPCQIQWNAKSKDDGTFTPIDINAKEYKGTTVSFPNSLLVVRQSDKQEKTCYTIEVTNFIGKAVQDISSKKYLFTISN